MESLKTHPRRIVALRLDARRRSRAKVLRLTGLTGRRVYPYTRARTRARMCSYIAARQTRQAIRLSGVFLTDAEVPKTRAEVTQRLRAEFKLLQPARQAT